MEKHLTQHNAVPAISEGLTKTQIIKLAKQSVDNVLEDHSFIFQVAEAIAAMEEFAKQVRKDERFVEILRDEIIKHNGKTATPSGAKLEICEAGVSYDYSVDAGWRSLEQEIQELTEKRKALEEKLRRIAPGKMWVDDETGEVLEGPLKISKSTYRITLGK
jgi:hypothetical protein